MESANIALTATPAPAKAAPRSTSELRQRQSAPSFAAVLAKSSASETPQPTHPAKTSKSCAPNKPAKATATTSPDDDASAGGANNFSTGNVAVALFVAQPFLVVEPTPTQGVSIQPGPATAKESATQAAPVDAQEEPEVEADAAKLIEDSKVEAVVTPNLEGSEVPLAKDASDAAQASQSDPITVEQAAGDADSKQIPLADGDVQRVAKDVAATATPTQGSEKPRAAIFDPAMEVVALHARRLRETAGPPSSVQDCPPVVELTVKQAPQNGAATANSVYAHTPANSAQAILPRHELEQLRNNFVAKANGPNAPPVPTNSAPSPAIGQQEKAKPEQDASRQGQGDQKNGPTAGDQADFVASAAKVVRAAANPDDTVSAAVESKSTEDTTSVVNLISPPPGHTGIGSETAIAASSATTTAPSSPSWKAPDEMPGKGVSLAQLADAATHSEMRIAMQTDKLGNVELRAHVSGETVGAAITVEKRDAHSVLAMELPALQQALTEKSLRVDQVALFQGALDLTHSNSGRDQGQNNSHPVQQQSKPWLAGSTTPPVIGGDALQSGAFDAAGRLNVLA